MTKRTKNPKTEQSGTPEVLSDIIKSAQSMLGMTPVLQPQMEQFWDAQEKMLSEAEGFTRHWFERRHQATRTALDAVKQATSGEKSDPVSAMQTMSDWQKHSVERMTEDAREWFDMMTRCTREVVESELEAADETAKKASEQVARAKKSGAATPV